MCLIISIKLEDVHQFPKTFSSETVRVFCLEYKGFSSSQFYPVISKSLYYGRETASECVCLSVWMSRK